MFDILVVGGGVVGGTVLRELSKFDLSCCLLEKEGDVCMGQSKANSGIVHAGFDAEEGSLKAKFNVRGAEMMPALAKELGVRYANNGSLVVAFSEEDKKTLGMLKKRGEKNGVKGLKILSKEELFSMEPNISDEAEGALLAETAGIICPYGLTIAAIGNAMDNGAELKTNFDVSKIEKTKEGFKVTSKKGETVLGKAVINCAGLGSQKIANLAGDYSFTVGGRRGEYILLDRKSGGFVSHTLFFTPTALGKGILVTPTADGNLLLGPTAKNQDGGSAHTDADGFDFIIEKVHKMCKNPPLYDTVTSFAGVRAYCDRHDFIIEESKAVPGLINCAGIESPGLTSAPAIAEYVVNTLVGKLMPLKKKAGFDGRRQPAEFFRDADPLTKSRIVKEDPAYGRMVCRCETVTEGEILRALRVNPKATDIDGVKRRTRAGMGRCQGGFCNSVVAEIIAKELNIPLDEVTKSGEGSEVLVGGRK